MHGVAVLKRQWCPVASGLDRDALEPFGDPVGRDIGLEREVTPECDGGVGPVHRHLMQPAPDPPVRRTRPEKSPDRGFHARQLDSVDQPLGAALQPRDRIGGIRWRLATFDAARIEVLVASFADDLCSPAVTTADVAQQLLEAPARTGRHGQGLVGVANQIRESPTLLQECGRVIHVARLPPVGCFDVRGVIYIGEDEGHTGDDEMRLLLEKDWTEVDSRLPVQRWGVRDRVTVYER